MIELKENDLVKVKIDGEINLIVSHDIFVDTLLTYDIIAVWRYDETADNFVKIYDKEESKTGD